MVHSGQFVTPLLCSRQDKTKKGSFTVCYSEILKNSLLYFIKNKLGEIKKKFLLPACLPVTIMLRTSQIVLVQEPAGYNGAGNLSCRPGVKDLSVAMVPGTCVVVLVSKICRLQWCQEPVLSSWCQRSVSYNGARNLSGCPGGSQISALLRPREPVRILILKYFQKLQKGAGTVYTVHSQEIQT